MRGNIYLSSHREEEVMLLVRGAKRSSGGQLLVRIVIALLIGWHTPALGQAGPSLLVLNIIEDGRPQDDLRAYVTEELGRVGAQPVDPLLLTPAERSCQSRGCLRSLAQAYKVALILTTRIDRQPSGDRAVAMWLYDARKGVDFINRGGCAHDDVERCLGNLAQQLVGPQLSGADSGSRQTEPSPDSLKPSPGPASPRPWRRWVAIGLGGLAAAALASAVALHSLEGQPVAGDCSTPEGLPSHCVAYFRPLYGTGYAAAAALTLGAILTVTLPRGKELRR